MANSRTVSEFGNDYKCTSFFDVDTQTSGVDVARDGEHIGSIIGLHIPDEYDSEFEVEVKKFDKEVINWIVDNDQ